MPGKQTISPRPAPGAPPTSRVPPDLPREPGGHHLPLTCPGSAAPPPRLLCHGHLLIPQVTCTACEADPPADGAPLRRPGVNTGPTSQWLSTHAQGPPTVESHSHSAGAHSGHSARGSPSPASRPSGRPHLPLGRPNTLPTRTVPLHHHPAHKAFFIPKTPIYRRQSLTG